MVLQLKEEIIFSKAVLILPCNLLRLVIKASDNVSRDFSCQTGRQANKTLVISLKRLKIHSRPVIIALCEAY